MPSQQHRAARRSRSRAVAPGSGVPCAPRDTPTPTPARRAVFTIVSANYIAYAATLMQSVRQHDPGTGRFVILVDAPQEFPGLDLAADLVLATSLGIPGFANMALWYGVMELNTAVKPSAFLHLFGQGFGQVAYLDPDILVTAPLAEVWDGLDGHSCVLTPHHLHPLQDGGHPSDLTILKAGVYNLGFLGLCADADGTRLARWWADRLLAHCRVDIPGHMFTDQRWMDLAPALVERVLILRHPGCNLAYWNLPHRGVAGSATGGFTVDGRPLVFAHFSGIDPGDPASFSKHQDRFAAATLPPAMAALCATYRAHLIANGWAVSSKLPYAYASFPGGRAIEPLMRRWLLRALDEGRLDPHAPAQVAADYFDAPEHAGTPVTRLLHQLWLDRPDLQAHFAVANPDGAAAYLGWVLSGGGAEAGLDPCSIEAARRLAQPGSCPSLPPWASVLDDVWAGPSAAAAAFLAESVRFTLAGAPCMLPRGLAQAWERRPDLQQHFPLRTADSLDAYVGWCITTGLAEGSVSAEMLSPDLLAWLQAVPADSPPTPDVPLTRALLLTRGCLLGQGLLPPAQGDVDGRPARLTHAFWFAYIAPALLPWPDALAAPVRAWFAGQGDASAAGFRFSRGALVLWWLRPDVAAAHPLFDEPSRRDYLLWLLLHGLRELGLEVEAFDPGLARQLAQDMPGLPGVPWFAGLLHACRPDLRDGFDLSDPAGRDAFTAWSREFLAPEYAGTPAGRCLRLPGSGATAALTVRAGVALTGYWTGQTGIGEFLRGTAAALLHAGFEDFVVVDRMTGLVHRPDGTPLPPCAAVKAEVNLVHMNAETAAADWAWMRARRIDAARTVGWWAWELEALPRRWHPAYSYYDEVWGISAFAAAALRAPGLRPVRAVPHPVCLPDGFVPAPRAAYGFAAHETVFLFMFDPHSYLARKNPAGVVQAFLRAFPAGDEPVRLVLKTHHGADFPDAFAALRTLAADPRIELRDEVRDAGGRAGPGRRCRRLRVAAPGRGLRARSGGGHAAGQARHPDRLLRHAGLRRRRGRAARSLHPGPGRAGRVPRRGRPALGRAGPGRRRRAHALGAAQPRCRPRPGPPRPSPHRRPARPAGVRRGHPGSAAATAPAGASACIPSGGATGPARGTEARTHPGPCRAAHGFRRAAPAQATGPGLCVRAWPGYAWPCCARVGHTGPSGSV